MEQISDMAALFATKAGGAAGISPVEHLLSEFEAHEANEEKSIEDYKKLLGSRDFSCISSFQTRKNIARC